MLRVFRPTRGSSSNSSSIQASRPWRCGAGGAAEGATDPGDLDLDNNARRLIRAALTRAGGNKTLAAKLLGMSSRQLHYRLQKLGINGP